MRGLGPRRKLRTVCSVGQTVGVTTESSSTDDPSGPGRGLLPIGAFSRASLLSIKMLRAYHEAGLLVPAEVDTHTGYRSYHWSQLADAGVIRRLRALDLPLEQVGEVVRASDPTVTRSVLEAHRSAMQERLEDVVRALDELDGALSHPASHTPVHVRQVPAMTVVALSGKVREQDFSAFLGPAYDRLDQVMAALEVSPAGPPGALYPPEISDDLEEIEAYFPLPDRSLAADDDRLAGVVAPHETISVQELPAITSALTVHTGAYDTIGDAYRLLGAWVARNAEPGQLPVREVYLVSYGDVDDPAQFRTEIQWPVEI